MSTTFYIVSLILCQKYVELKEKGRFMAGFAVSEDSKNIGIRMKQILKQINITQEQAAFRLGLSSASALHHYMSGRRELPISVINRFCTEFNIPVATLFANDDITLNTENDLVLDIMLAIDEFLAEKHLALTGEQRKKLVKDFLAKDCHDANLIKSTLSALHAINSEMFSKGK
jgi:transcriptional regulator with XRE-family HTH domain